jgi:hypothetical protein
VLPERAAVEFRAGVDADGGSEQRSNAGNHENQRHGVPGRWRARSRDAADIVAGVYHGGQKSRGCGVKSIQLGSQGALSVDLIPNAGAVPAGTLYKIVYKLDDGSTATEFWSVGTASPTTIASVRTTPGSGTASAIVSREYVDTVVAGKANDTAVVHNAGNEVIGGSKQFSAPPSVPTPLLASDAANKAYVDSSVAAVGSGSYVAKAGDTMSGPLTLPGERNDIRRGVYDRLINGFIAVVVSVAIALHDHLGLR